MRRSITTGLPEQVNNELDSWVDAHGLSRSAAVREVIHEYLFIHRFRELRRELTKHAAGRNLHTDEDVFREIS